MKFIASLFAAVFGIASVHAEVIGKSVEYEIDGKIFEGYHAYSDQIDDGPRPAILIIHQWTGLSDYEKMRADMLAKLGYNVLAADVYGKGIRPQPPEAGKISGQLKEDRELLRARMQKAYLVLKGDKRTDGKRIAAIGYCFGGTGVLEMARAGTELSGVVSYHGGLGAKEGMEANKETLKTKILAFHGAIDPYVPAAEVAAFEAEMKQANADWQMVTYGGAVHAFTQKMAGDDPSKGAAYNEQADHRSWKATMQFFAEIFAN